LQIECRSLNRLLLIACQPRETVGERICDAEFHHCTLNALASVLQIIRHMKVSVHASLQYRDPPQFVELRRVPLIVESTSYKNIEIRIAGLTAPPRPDRAELPFRIPGR